MTALLAKFLPIFFVIFHDVIRKIFKKTFFLL